MPEYMAMVECQKRLDTSVRIYNETIKDGMVAKFGDSPAKQVDRAKMLVATGGGIGKGV